MPQGGLLAMHARRCRVDEDAVLSPGHYVEIAVSDTGTGMPADVVARAFEPFFTTKGIGKGTGLGLSQVYGMARQAGGDTLIRSEPGRGTTVTLRLPHFEGPVDHPPSPQPPSDARSSVQSALSVLVIDDDPQVRGVLDASLGFLGHTITVAEDGPSGLRALEAQAFDLMICDFAMPGMNGAEVARLARQRHSALPIIFASGHADVKAIRAAVGAGPTILRKPFDVTEIEQAVNAVVNGPEPRELRETKAGGAV